MSKILLLAGPGGAGKTTVAEILARDHGYTLLDAESLDAPFFPRGGQWLPENEAELRKGHALIIEQTKKLHEAGNKVVIDYIIFGRYSDFLRELRQAVGNDLTVKVLFPSEKETVRRDAERECWTTGYERIKQVRIEYEALRGEIGNENYIDTTDMTPEETAAQVLQD